MSRHDIPLWARGAGAGLVVFASWWLLHTDALVGAVGSSIAAVSLGVIGGSMLRGMHLPLHLWPDGPWRRTFSTLSVVGSGAVVAALVLLSNARAYPSLQERLDPGTWLAVVAGTLAWGFALALVRQRPYWRWFGVALAAGLGPHVVALLFSLGGDGGLCLVSAQVTEPEGAGTLRCAAAAVPALVYVTVLSTTMMLVTEELAFRRLLLGGSGRTGMAVVVAGAIVAFLWYAVVARAGGVGATLPLLGGLGALGAGSLYVLSRSLLVSALYSGSFAGGYWALTYASAAPDVRLGEPVVQAAVWVVGAGIAGTLLALVYRRHGLTGDLLADSGSDASGN